MTHFPTFCHMPHFISLHIYQAVQCMIKVGPHFCQYIGGVLSFLAEGKTRISVGLSVAVLVGCLNLQK